MATPLYLKDTYLPECSGFITNHGIDEKGAYLLLNETVFYPQGGGQPSDQGTIKTASGELNVGFVRQIDQEIRHYVSDATQLPSIIDTKITCNIDQPRRLLNARYHTAAHLLSNVIENMHPKLKAVKGHSFPGEAYVEFIGEDIPETTKVSFNMRAAITQGLNTTTFEILPDEFARKYYSLPYPVPTHKAFRVLQIGNFMPIPCGGTHIKNTTEIGEFNIRKISKKGERLKVAYELPNSQV